MDILLKTDLAEDQSASRTGIGRPYDHSGGIELSTVREKDENLTYVLQEIKDIRSEMQQIYARLPARSDATDGEQ